MSKDDDIIKISKSYIDELVYIKLFQAQFIQEHGLMGEFTRWCQEKQNDLFTLGGMIKGEDKDE